MPLPFVLYPTNFETQDTSHQTTHHPILVHPAKSRGRPSNPIVHKRSNTDEISQPIMMNGTASFPYKPAPTTETQESEGENDVPRSTGESNSDGTPEWQEAGHIIVVSSDPTRIRSPAPGNPQDKKQAFIDVFLYFSKVIFFLNLGVDLRSEFPLHSGDSTEHSITAAETTRLIKAQGKTSVR